MCFRGLFRATCTTWKAHVFRIAVQCNNCNQSDNRTDVIGPRKWTNPSRLVLYQFYFDTNTYTCARIFRLHFIIAPTLRSFVILKSYGCRNVRNMRYHTEKCVIRRRMLRNTIFLRLIYAIIVQTDLCI